MGLPVLPPFSVCLLAALLCRCACEDQKRRYVRTERRRASNDDGRDRLPLIPFPAHVAWDASAPLLAVAGDVSLRVHGLDDSDIAVQTLQDHFLKATKAASLLEVGHHHSHHLESRSHAHPAIRKAAAIREIHAELIPDSRGSAESYNLNIGEDGIHLTGPSPAGIFYGVQTLRQLTKWDGGPKLPQVHIQDSPRFAWRGLHLDVSRHFFGARDVKRLLDTMGMFKLNRFHWHLTDDQGWRLPVEGYPKLTQIGSRGVDGAHSYTADEIRDVVAFARARHIEVLPEVDVPGHVAAAVAAYPELGNSDIPGWAGPRVPEHTWGVHEHTLAPSIATEKFLDKVYGTVTDLFPAAWVHIGGDETQTEEWRRSPHARSAASLLGTDAGHLQQYFNAEVSHILESKGRTPIAWDETQHIGGLPRDAIVMAWRSSDEARLAVSSGKKVIVADQGAYYFDHYQGPESEEPKAICCHTSLAQVYDYEPVPSSYTAEQRAQVLGGQGELWSEYFPNFRQVEYMAYPRSMALAERLWTPEDKIVGFEDFNRRLHLRVKDLDQLGIHYRHLTEKDDF